MKYSGNIGPLVLLHTPAYWFYMDQNNCTQVKLLTDYPLLRPLPITSNCGLTQHAYYMTHPLHRAAILHTMPATSDLGLRLGLGVGLGSPAVTPGVNMLHLRGGVVY